MRVKIVLAIIIISLLCCGCEEKQSNEQPTSLSQTSQSITEITTFATTTPPETVAEITQDKTQYVEVSEGHEFIDFEFIEDYVGITNPAEVQAAIDAAAKALISSEFYTVSVENIDTYSQGQLDGFLDESGSIKPVFNQAFVEDFDGDGNKETFILMDMPYPKFTNSLENRSFLLFVDFNNNAQVINDYFLIDHIHLLNYEKNKHLIIGPSGVVGVDFITSLYGVRDSEAVLFYEFRGELVKTDCFLSGRGHQTGGDFMYFDTVELEYRVIRGELLDMETLTAMDTTNLFKEYIDEGFYQMYDFGGKYYCGSRGYDFGDSYIYENNQFVLLENSELRVSRNWNNLNVVTKIDIGKAIEEMQKPVNP